MKQFIAPRVLKVNGQPAPCKCTDTIICEYCVQANLVLYEREQHPETEISQKLIESIEQKGVRKTSRILGVPLSTVSSWIKNKNIPQKYVESVRGAR
jgi:hypothetical protein